MLKTLTFTIMHFGIAFSVTYTLTGSASVSGLVALVEPLCNSVGFYVHEKAWKRIEGSSIPGKTERPPRTWLHQHV